jgi:hypothetical protein
VSSIVLGDFDAPAYVFKLIVFIILLGFPLVLVFSLVYGITPEGIKKTDYIKKCLHGC